MKTVAVAVYDEYGDELFYATQDKKRQNEYSWVFWEFNEVVELVGEGARWVLIQDSREVCVWN